MGNWRDRRRRIFRKEKTPWSAIRNYDHDPPLEFWKDDIPIWEKKFCTEIGRVPWGKVVDSKNFIDCHANILNWDDSACKEAFHNAKRCFWAEINGHQCDDYRPDPNIYIEKIDWNPEIDSELIKELDLVYCGCSVPQNDVWSQCKNKKTSNSSSVSIEGNIVDSDHVDSPQEHGTKCIDNTEQGWSRWNLSDSEKVNNDGNPWDSYITQKSRDMVDNSRRDKVHQGGTPWKMKELASQGGTPWKTKELASQGGTPWKTKELASQGGTPWKTKELASQGGTPWKTKEHASDARNNAWGWSQQGASNFDHYNRPWNNSYDRNVRNLTDRIRPNILGNGQEWKYQGRYGKRPKDVAFEKAGNWGSWPHHSSQKGEVPNQRVLKASKR